MYTVSEIPGGGVPYRLNNLGDLAGRAADDLGSGEVRATTWNGGASRRRNLGKLQGGDYSAAYGINDSGEVAGSGNVTDSIVPFLWIAGAGFRRIPLLPGDNCGQALAINRARLLRSIMMAMPLELRRAQMACERSYGLKLLERRNWGYSPVGILAEPSLLTMRGR